MIKNIKRICVFASSSNDLDEVFYKDAARLGCLIAQNNCDIVYGGSRLGLMYACAEAVKNHGGKIYGVMPERIASFGCANPDDCEEFYLTKGMRERKAKLDELSDAVISIAGGFGTLEEVSELIVQKQLGYNNKPIVFLNTAGFYDKLLEFFDNIISKKFANPGANQLYYIASTPEEAIDYIKTYKPIDFGSKFVRK